MPSIVSRVLVVSRDQVRSRMAAPGIRLAEISRYLASAGNDVTLALPHEPELSLSGVSQVFAGEKEVGELARATDVAVLSGAGHHLMPLPQIPRTVPTVIDLSFPVVLEVLAVPQRPRSIWPPATPPAQLVDRLVHYLRDGDFLMCASQDQRNLYLGCLLILGRFDEQTLRSDPTLHDLLSIVPFGCPPTPPNRTGPGPRERIDGIRRDDFVLLWSGGLGDWYDPEVVVRAVARAAPRVPNLKLVVIGARSGIEHLPETATSAAVRALAGELHVLGRHVFFHDEWVPYDSRADWIEDADVAVIASHPSLESDIAVRTRFLDYVWCTTPVLCTRGGAYADLVERRQLGMVVSPGDVSAMADAIVTMADRNLRSGMKERLSSLRPELAWPHVLKPLLEFCAHPRVAPDRALSRPPAGRTPQPGLERQVTEPTRLKDRLAARLRR